MKRLLVFLMLSLLLAGPAGAHSLRVFARVENGMVSGYGFFVGGGRPQDVSWIAAMEGAEIARGRTDAEGGFSFPAPDPVTGPVTITINSGEGHVAARELGVERFGQAAAPAGQGVVVSPAAEGTAAPEGGDALTRAMVEAAVAHEVAPLLERIEQMDARMRLTDIVAALCLIFGIAGIALWARGRRG